MAIEEVRALIGDDKIIGVSTHSASQAKDAIKRGANYIGVGPIYKTTTKDTPPVGLEYLEWAVRNVTIPFVAIGGIKVHNIDKIVKAGAKHICLVSEIVSSDDIVKKIELLNSKIKQ